MTLINGDIKMAEMRRFMALESLRLESTVHQPANWINPPVVEKSLDYQLGVRWRNSFRASIAATIGQTEIATIIAKNNASTTNSQLISVPK
jgi:hypothetical protein